MVGSTLNAAVLGVFGLQRLVDTMCRRALYVVDTLSPVPSEESLRDPRYYCVCRARPCPPVRFLLPSGGVSSALDAAVLGVPGLRRLVHATRPTRC